MLVGCLITLIIYAIILLIVVYVFEAVLGAFGVPVPGQIAWLIRLLVALILLLWFIQCLGVAGMSLTHLYRP